MKNNAISDGHIIASSEFDFNHAAIQGRLNFKKTVTKAGSWSAATNDVHQWLQIDLGSLYTKVTRVITQGSDGHDQWVTKYKLQYGDDGVNFQYYREQGQNVDKVKDACLFHFAFTEHSAIFPGTSKFNIVWLSIRPQLHVVTLMLCLKKI